MKYADVRKFGVMQILQLWRARINAAARINGTTYSRFIAGLTKAGVEVNRKMLADLAVNDAAAFAKLFEVAKNA